MLKLRYWGVLQNITPFPLTDLEVKIMNFEVWGYVKCPESLLFHYAQMYVVYT